MSNHLAECLSDQLDLTALSQGLSRDSKTESIGEVAFAYLDTLPRINVFKYGGGIVSFDGRSYVFDKLEVLENAIFNSMRDNRVSAGTLTKSFQSMSKAVMRGLDSREFEVDRTKLCFKNCILDAATKQVSEFSAEHMVINRIDYDYDPEAKCPKWDAFIEEVLPNKSVRDAFQDFLGLLFVNRETSKLEKMMVLLGVGANGKSVVYETITAMLGSDNVSGFELSDLVSGNDKAKNLASINGKMLNYASDLGKKELTGSLIKSLVSGEPVQARQIYSESFTVKAIPLLMANCNELPVTSDYSKGYFRRWLVIPFDVEIPPERRNVNLHTELRGELSGILNWCLKGHDRVASNNYFITEPNEVSDKVKEYEINSNSILTFLKESELRPIPVYKSQPDSSKSAGDLYQAYREFCSSYGCLAFSRVKFAEKLKDKAFVKFRTQNGHSYRYYKLPAPDEYTSLVKAEKISMSLEEFNRICGWKSEDMGGERPETRTELAPKTYKQKELAFIEAGNEEEPPF